MFSLSFALGYGLGFFLSWTSSSTGSVGRLLLLREEVPDLSHPRCQHLWDLLDPFLLEMDFHLRRLLCSCCLSMARIPLPIDLQDLGRSTEEREDLC